MRAELQGYRVRNAGTDDLEALARFEIEIARISFPDDPVVDPEVHRKKLQKALERDRAGMFVAEHAETGRASGWLWVALNSNFLTGEHYANFRSLAVEPGPDSSQVAELLFGRGIEYARQNGAGEITGKVHVSNVPMRVIYRQFGFKAEHLTMKKRLENRNQKSEVSHSGLTSDF
jgi:ribosomal protein S18 acetylase RimI-like enzyme